MDGLPEQVFAYTRTHSDDRALVLLNVSHDAVTVELPADLQRVKLLASTHGDAIAGPRVSLRAHEGCLYQLT
jgi:hypothetical protein